MQYGHSLVAGAGAGFLKRFACFTIMNTTKATTRKLVIVLTNWPYATTGAPAAFAATKLG